MFNPGSDALAVAAAHLTAAIVNGEISQGGIGGSPYVRVMEVFQNVFDDLDDKVHSEQA